MILDACVLIDICLEDTGLLALAAASLGRVVVLSPILEEVHQLNEKEAERLGLSVVEPEMNLVLEASVRRGGLSFRDRICLLYTKDANGTLYTNDRVLLNAATSDGVDARWGLEILLELVTVGRLNCSRASVTARSICDRSRFASDKLIAEFEQRLRRL